MEEGVYGTGLGIFCDGLRGEDVLQGYFGLVAGCMGLQFICIRKYK